MGITSQVNSQWARKFRKSLEEMVLSEIPTARAFQAIRSVSISELSLLRDEELRPLLPCLVRMALCSPVDESAKWTEARKEVQKLLSGLEIVNSIVALLSVDFNLLEQDALKEQQLRRKIGGGSGTSILVESLQSGLALEFERSTSEPSRRLRLVLSELLRIMNQVSPTLPISYSSAVYINYFIASYRGWGLADKMTLSLRSLFG